MVRLSGRLAPNRHVRTKNQIRVFDRQKFISDGGCRQRVAEQILSKFPSLRSQPNSISEMAESLAKVVLEAEAKEVQTPPTSHTQTPLVRVRGTVVAFK